MKTNERPNLLIVTRDGELDPTYVREKRVEAFTSVLTGAAELVGYLARKALHEASELVYEIDLGIKDDMHGTDYQREYRDHKREAAALAIRGSWR